MSIRRTATFFLGLVVLGWMGVFAVAQDKNAEEPSAEPSTFEPAQVGQQIRITFAPVQMLNRERFDLPLELHAGKKLEITAPFLSVVRQISARPGEEVVVEGEVVRLENRPQQIAVDKAKALVDAATIEVEIASEANENGRAISLAQAKLAAAQADLALAEYELAQTSLRAPFAGVVQRIDVIPGQTVRPGESVLTLIDSTKLKVELPMAREDAEVGNEITLQVEDAEVPGKVVMVQPLAERFQPLRLLAESVVSAVIEIDNAKGELRPGQSVYIPLVPRDPIAEVPATAIVPHGDGQMKVQVLRKGIVRDVPVETLAGVGTSTVLVTGALAADDEVIDDRSHELVDGMQLVQDPPEIQPDARSRRGVPAVGGQNREPPRHRSADP